MELYIGIDMGWKSFRYEVRDKFGGKVKTGGGEATPTGLKTVLKKLIKSKSACVAFEAGMQMYWIDATIKELGVESYPFHAGDFALSVKSKNKTDKKDAEKIAKAACKDNLPRRIAVPAELEREAREALRERKQQQNNLVRCGNQLRAYGIALGFELETKRLSQKISDWEKALERFQGTRFEKTSKRLYRSALTAFQNLEEIEEELKDLSRESEWKEARKILESVPGVGYCTSMALLAWCGPEASRFASSRHAASYFGLTGRTYQSGKLNRQGKITKCGPPLVRSLMVQAAWAFLRSREGKNSQWGVWFRRRTARAGNQKKKIIVGLARKILTAAIACLQKGTLWDSDHLKKQAA